MILTRPGPTSRLIAETEWTRHCNSAEMSHCTLWSSSSRTRTLELKGNGGYRTVERVKRGIFTINMRDRSQNRKPLQRGRNLSIEAIQAVQALKRAKRDESSLERVFESKVRRLLKLDMIAVLKQLLNQNECLLALKVFDDVRKEYWYKPQVSLYAEMIRVLGSNGLFEQVHLLLSYLKKETGLELETEGFNALLRTLIDFDMTGPAMECFQLMKTSGCEPNKSSFRILIKGLESKGELDISATVKLDAQKYFGESLEFLEEEEDMTVGFNYN